MRETTLPVAELEDAYRRWDESRGADPEPFMRLLADEIEMRSVIDPAAGVALATPRRSKAEARAYFTGVVQEWEMLGFPQENIVADGDTIVWIGRCQWRHRASGREVDTPKIDVWTFRDGKATGFSEMFDTLAFSRGAGLI